MLIVNGPAFAFGSKKDNTWRHVARLARVALEKKDFRRADEGYQQAIAMLERTDPQSESIVNLKLLLVEVYRRQGNLVYATQLLDKIEPLINNESFDPLLPARYWERRADVDFSKRSNAKALLELQNSHRILEKFFFPDSTMMTRCYIYRLNVACKVKEYSQILEVLKQLKQTSEKTRTKIDPKYFESVCQMATGSVHELVLGLLKKGQYGQAASVLKQFSDSCPFPSMAAALWLGYLDLSFQKNKLAEACLAIDGINKLFEDAKGLPRNLDTMRREIDCRIGLNTLYSRLGNHQADAYGEWESIRQIVKAIGPDCNATDKYRGYQANSTLLNLEFKNGQISDKGMELVQAMSDYSVLPFDKSISKPMEHDMKNFHLAGRLELMHMSLVRNDPIRARAALHSINQQILNEMSTKDISIKIRLARMGAWMAQLFVQTKDLTSAHNAALESIKLLEPLPDYTDKDKDIALLMQLLKSTTPQDSNVKTKQ